MMREGVPPPEVVGIRQIGSGQGLGSNIYGDGSLSGGFSAGNTILRWLLNAVGPRTTPSYELTFDDGTKTTIFNGEPTTEGLAGQALLGAPFLLKGKVSGAKPVTGTPATLKAVDLKGILKGFNTNLAQESKFFGWTRSTISKSLSDFTKEELLARGWTKERLEKVAGAYEHIARITPENPSAAGRASQLRSIIKEFFP